jgi:UDP-2-acetamido-2,6-beta-L-arabino-hexul-4-ose reductase
MKILVTGAKGFIGKNLISELENRRIGEILEFDKDTDISLLDDYARDCEFVFHLAGVNRPKDEKEFMEGNSEFTSILLNKLKEYNNKAPILITSSTQAELDNPYGKSKKAGEDKLFTYEKEIGRKVLVYRLPNVFGKWCRPNYNSVIATFCNNIANDIEIKVNDPSVIMNLVYIDDVVEEFIHALKGCENKLKQYCSIPVVYTVALGRIVDLIYSYQYSREKLSVPDMKDEFSKKLYSTYLSYLPKDKFSYPLKMNIDDRGSFTEFIRTADSGQVSINIIKPGITKGNHWHHTKNEKFLVVSGDGLIQFRKIDSEEVINYHVTGSKFEVVDIPPGYTHNISNVGKVDMVVVMWANEAFNPEKPDTYFLEV